MRRFIAIALLVLLLAVPVHAAGTVTDAQSMTTISSDGSCQVVLTMTLQLTEAPDQLVLPLPRDAIDITVNGSNARTQVSGEMRNVDLTRQIYAAGTHTVVVQYTIPDAVEADEEGALTLTVPILSGFSCPVSQLEFRITLPGDLEVTPKFSSTYHPQTMDAFLAFSVQGDSVSGRVTTVLKDHESLTMTMPVTADMFPQPIAKQWSLSFDDVAMVGLVLLAGLYWFAGMRTRFPRRLRRTEEPAGLTAGELGCCLTGQGVDFTLTVLSWAQMGYIFIQWDRNGRILLHKRMEMGNERSDFEIRLFRRLFGARHTVDGTGSHYARLCRKARHYCPDLHTYFRRNSANPNIFRLLLLLSGLFAGISMAFAFVSDTAWRILLSILLGLGSVAASWLLQNMGRVLHLRRRGEPALAVIAAVAWIGLGIWAGEAGVAILAVIIQFVGGIMAAYGGIRSELGQTTRDEILSLRYYLKNLSRGEVLQILRSNPEYYHRMAPYALALGVDRQFSREFGSMGLPECSYLSAGRSRELTGRDFSRLLRRTADRLDELQKKVEGK